MKQSRKPIFFTADWHIGHANSIVFDDRPFKDLDHMHRVLVNNYNAVVPDDGICYFLGDIGMGNIEMLKEVIGKLNGTKILILGNHDGNVNRMYNMGFDAVLHGAIMYIAGEKVTLTHCPLRGLFREDTTGMNRAVEGENWHKEATHLKFAIEDEGQFHLCGHTHARGLDINGKAVIQGRQWDVGVCGNGFRPISISAVESLICKTIRKELDRKADTIWANLVGFPGYKISNYGEVKSYKRHKIGKLLFPYTDKDGYRCVSLRVNGDSKAEKIHRAVAKAFLSNPDGFEQINHKNGKKDDNYYMNLEWCTHTKNQHHAWDTGLKKRKLSREDVLEIRELINDGEMNKDIAIKFNVDPSLISNIKHDKIWKRVKK